MRIAIFGLGYTGTRLARRLSARGLDVLGTRRASTAGDTPWRCLAWSGGFDPAVAAALDGVTHVILSIPPQTAEDPVIAAFGDVLARSTSLRWVGYLSTIGVYGDRGGAVIDETVPVRPQSPRAALRVAAETDVWSWGQVAGKATTVYRLPGIYGPGRSAIDSLLAGTARRIVKPGQVFNRIHVDDIVRALEASLDVAPLAPLYNLTDGHPAPPEDVIAHAAHLLGMAPPPEEPFETADLTPMARSFYGECKRIDSARIWADLWLEPLYPTYQDGLAAIMAETRRSPGIQPSFSAK